MRGERMRESSHSWKRDLRIRRGPIAAHVLHKLTGEKVLRHRWVADEAVLDTGGQDGSTRQGSIRQSHRSGRGSIRTVVIGKDGQRVSSSAGALLRD